MSYENYLDGVQNLKTYVDGKVSDVVVPTKTSDLTNDSGFRTVTTDTITLEASGAFGWQTLVGTPPFAFYNGLTYNGLRDNTIVSLSMDVMYQAMYGIVGDVIDNSIFFYALTQPPADITITVIMED